jgi:hypothetical protein
MALLQRELQLLRQPFRLRSRSDEAGNVIETHEHAGEFKEWQHAKDVCLYRVSWTF